MMILCHHTKFQNFRTRFSYIYIYIYFKKELQIQVPNKLSQIFDFWKFIMDMMFIYLLVS
jgi:hypothetical protein